MLIVSFQLGSQEADSEHLKGLGCSTDSTQ